MHVNQLKEKQVKRKKNHEQIASNHLIYLRPKIFATFQNILRGTDN